MSGLTLTLIGMSRIDDLPDDQLDELKELLRDVVRSVPTPRDGWGDSDDRLAPRIFRQGYVKWVAYYYHDGGTMSIVLAGEGEMSKLLALTKKSKRGSVHDEDTIALRVAETILEKAKDDLCEMIDVQCSNGNWNYDPYMHEMANGMLFSESILAEEDLEYVEAPDKWLSDMPSSKELLVASRVAVRVRAKPTNQRRRLKDRLNQEPLKERGTMPPPTIRHKDKRRRKRQDDKADLRKEYVGGVIGALREMGVVLPVDDVGVRTGGDIRWQAVFFIGVAGSGKSFVKTKRYLRHLDFKEVDPDEIKRTHKDYDPERPFDLHAWSKSVADGEYKRLVSDGSGSPVIVDGTGRNWKGIGAKISLAERNGYRTYLVYVHVPLSVSLYRNRNRERFVPEKIVLEQSRMMSESFRELKSRVDKWKVIQNYSKSEEKDADMDVRLYPPPLLDRPLRPGDDGYGD